MAAVPLALVAGGRPLARLLPLLVAAAVALAVALAVAVALALAVREAGGANHGGGCFAVHTSS